MAATVIKKAQVSMQFPLLQEVQFKIDKHISSASDVLLNDEETAIHDFLQNQVTSIFKHLKGTTPAIQKDVDTYFAALDKNTGMIYHHRKEFEESIAKINEQVSRFVDREQTSVQQIFPHYFERYVTDGVEFNIYDDTVHILNVMRGGPSDKAGLKSGDKIIQVEAEKVAGNGIGSDKIRSLLRGPRGSKVKVTIFRESKSLPFTITRGFIPLFALDASCRTPEGDGWERQVSVASGVPCLKPAV